MPARSWHRPAIALLLLVVGCSQGSPTASGDVSGAPSSGPSAGQAGALPPGCEPIDLRGPSGETLVLDGTWTAESHSSGLPKTWWIRTLGDCLWGAGAVGGPGDAALFEIPTAGRLQTLRGTIGRDYVVEGEIVQVAMSEFAIGDERPYSPLRLLIDFDEDGTVVLREDREPSAEGPRCPDPTLFCLPVLVLRAEQTASETPDASAD
jgi:hypothetical protein